MRINFRCTGLRWINTIALYSILLTFAGADADAASESHPAWWAYASPEATALVGVRWENLRGSIFADAIGAELSRAGSLSFPDLACIKDAKQILISSPDLLAMVNGAFSPAVVRTQASATGLKAASYRGVEMWIAPGKDALSVAQVDNQLLLLGSRKTLESAVDRGLAEFRTYSPLLVRAARFDGVADLWVVSKELPDPLANLFVPLDAEAKSFEGGVSVKGGLTLDATLRAPSDQSAAETGEKLRASIPSLPSVARDLAVTVSASTVVLGLRVTEEQLNANLRRPETPAPAPKPEGPRIVRIVGLDEGVREIVLPPPVLTGPSK